MLTLITVIDVLVAAIIPEAVFEYVYELLIVELYNYNVEFVIKFINVAAFYIFE